MNHTNLEENIKGDDKIRAWKYEISLILEEDDLEKYVTEEVPEPDGDDSKATHKKNIVKSKRIIAD